LDTIGRSMLGPPLGSSLFQVSRSLPFWTDAASFLVSAAFVRRLPRMHAEKVAREPLLAARPSDADLMTLTEAARYLRVDPRDLLTAAAED
jgi:hypothetical protein